MIMTDRSRVCAGHWRLTGLRPVTTQAVFVSTAGTRLRYENISWTFIKLVRRAGLRPRSASCRPRLHDFRHSLAVRTLLDWYRGDADIATRLPLLSAWLGHTDPKNTYWYLDEGSGIASDGRESAGHLMAAAS